MTQWHNHIMGKEIFIHFSSIWIWCVQVKNIQILVFILLYDLTKLDIWFIPNLVLSHPYDILRLMACYMIVLPYDLFYLPWFIHLKPFPSPPIHLPYSFFYLFYPSLAPPPLLPCLLHSTTWPYNSYPGLLTQFANCNQNNNIWPFFLCICMLAKQSYPRVSGGGVGAIDNITNNNILALWKLLIYF